LTMHQQGVDRAIVVLVAFASIAVLVGVLEWMLEAIDLVAQAIHPVEPLRVVGTLDVEIFVVTPGKIRIGAVAHDHVLRCRALPAAEITLKKSPENGCRWCVVPPETALDGHGRHTGSARSVLRDMG